MKILIVTPTIGGNASGDVFEKLINELSKINKVDVLTYLSSKNSDIDSSCNVFACKKMYVHPRISKILIALFGINFFDYLWAINAKKLFMKQYNKQYDLVLTFMHSHQYAPLIAADKISANLNCKLSVYAIDAIPAPGWPENQMYYNGVQRFLKKYLSNIDSLFSSNEAMLKYQLTTFIPKNNLHTGVIYTPGPKSFKIFKICENEQFNFVYTGGLYGARNPKYIVEAFEKLLLDYPNSFLYFIGSNLDIDAFSNLKPATIKNIKCLPYTLDLNHYFENATALLDIDADIENDVFLSSKIIQYLFTNRIIISQTGTDSPSRKIFKNIVSIIQCNHNTLETYTAMKKAILVKNKITFDDRKIILQEFLIDNVIGKLNNSLSTLISN